MALSALASALLALNDDQDRLGDTLIPRIVTQYLHAPQQRYRLLSHLRHVFLPHWIAENLSAERGFDAVCAELREDYYLSTDKIFLENTRTQLARDWGQAHGLGERAPLYAQAARAAAERRVQETSSAEYARQTARRLVLLDAFAQSRGELAKLSRWTKVI